MKNGPYILVKAPSDYPGKKYRDKYCYEHVLIYWQNTGDLPGDDEQIHHKDEDKHHNEFSNLEKIKKGAHQKLHHKDDLMNIVKFKCTGCQEIFFRRRGNSFLVKGGRFCCCSQKCIGDTTAFQIAGNLVEYEKRISENIVEEFKGKMLIEEQVIPL